MVFVTFWANKIILLNCFLNWNTMATNVLRSSYFSFRSLLRTAVLILSAADFMRVIQFISLNFNHSYTIILYNIATIVYPRFFSNTFVIFSTIADPITIPGNLI